MYIFSFCDKIKLENHEIWILIQICSRVEIFGGQKFIPFWKTRYVTFERHISFLFSISEKKAALFTMHTENVHLIRNLIFLTWYTQLLPHFSSFPCNVFWRYCYEFWDLPLHDNFDVDVELSQTFTGGAVIIEN